MIIKKIILIFLSLSLAIGIFAQNVSIVKCKIWKPESFCNISDSLNIPTNISGKNVKWNTLTCLQIKNKNSLQGVHIRFSSKTDSTFSLKSKFKNITLKKNVGGKILHPYAILWYGMSYDSKSGKETSFIGYMTNRFKAKDYNVSYKMNTAYDLIILFNGAEQGDKIIIDNFLQAEITE